MRASTGAIDEVRRLRAWLDLAGEARWTLTDAVDALVAFAASREAEFVAFAVTTLPKSED